MRHLTGRSDVAFGSSSGRRSVVSKLSGSFPGVYSDRNVPIVSTHRHADAPDTPRTLSNNHTVWLLHLKQRTLPCWVPCSLRAYTSLAPGSLALGKVTIAARAHTWKFLRKNELNITPIKMGLTLLRFADASGAVRVFFCCAGIQYFV